jgi:F-box interacting protein
MRIVGSCNGLICLHKKDLQKPIYCILNPILGEFTVLPRPNPANPSFDWSQETGFGFCPKSKQYKVIRFLLTDNRKTAADIYTVGTKSWRNIGNVPNPRKKMGFDPFINGSLYWITDSNRSGDLICSFDLETELTKSVQPPSVFESSGYISKASRIGVGSMRNSLCLCYVYEELHFVVWVMKENGSKSDACWSKLFSIDFASYCGLSAKNFPRPIKFVDNGDGGELLLLCNLLSVFLYSPKKRTFRDVGMISSTKTNVFSYTPSFISIKNAAEVGGNYLKVQKFRQGQHLSPFRDEAAQENAQ